MDIILTESDRTDNITDKKDLEFLIKHELIKIKSGSIIPKFVGEVITPNNKYFSLPKNFTVDQAPLELSKKINIIKDILDEYKRNLKENKKDGVSLLTNNRFILGKDGFESEKYFFNRLKKFFLDFVTYEFIYPLETKKIHSQEPLEGQIDMVSTEINRNIYGSGITYDVFDKKNSIKWLLDDIYYQTIKELSDKYASDSEKREIEKMKNYLLEEGYSINTLSEYTDDKIIQEIKKCNVNIVHYPIKNTLLDYYKRKKLTESTYSINVFYTKHFQYVWENLVRRSLKHNPDDFGDLINRFSSTDIVEDWYPLSKKDEVDNLVDSGASVKKSNTGYYVSYEKTDLGPDLFSSHKGLKFIGDAKYYKDHDNADFNKEYSTYNSIMNNKYPMVIFIPSTITEITRGGYKRGRNVDDMRELIVFNISVEDALSDAMEKKDKVIDKVQSLLKKRSRRLNKLK
jgi:hypothetical protein